METESNDNPFWAESGIFSAQAICRMMDAEFISELVVAFLHGPQNKKGKLDDYYQMYEETFDAEAEVKSILRKVTSEIESLLPNLRQTRWKRKSDFYTLFMVFSELQSQLPFSSDQRLDIQEKLTRFSHDIDEYLKIETEENNEAYDQNIIRYAKAVARSASDIGTRRIRNQVLEEYLFGKPD